jgi:iron(III) transport system substrate-binding protein
MAIQRGPYRLDEGRAKGDRTMTETFRTSRRLVLGAGLALAAAPLAARAAPDIKTTADVAKAEAEGEVLFYTHDGEAGASAVVDGFSKDFPKIKANYLRAQNGALYNKILSERSAGRFSVDAIQFSEIGTAIDFQKKGGFEKYQSPQFAAYDTKYQSDPPGYWTWSGVTFAGIAYNTDRVKPGDAPKDWKDLLDPKWRNAISVKQATSGMQFAEWYIMRQMFGDDYWKQFAKQRPKGFDARAQLFDRLAKGDDKVCGLAEIAGYQLYHEKGAPIAFVAPPAGLPVTPTCAGVVSKAPHPEAAKLFIDWLLSPRGQAVTQGNEYLLYPSLRHDAPPLAGGMKLSDYKLLWPKDMNKYLASHDEFVKEWNGMLGL